MAGGFGELSEGMAATTIAAPLNAPTGEVWVRTEDGRIWQEVQMGESTNVTGMVIGYLRKGRMYPYPS